MREIIFRGKRNDNGEWVEGGVVPLDVESGYIFITEPFLSASTLPVYEIVKHHMHLVIPATVGQFTGLYDSTKWEDLSTEEQAEFLYPTNGGKRKKEDWKGKPIFEGDIVKIGKFSEPNKQYIVKYDLQVGAFLGQDKYNMYFVTFDCDSDQIEIIGNIHDNPELLGGEQ